MSKIIHIDSCGSCPYLKSEKYGFNYRCGKDRCYVINDIKVIDRVCPLEDHPIDKYWSDEDDMIIGIDKGSSEGDHSAEITFDTSKLSKEERELTNKSINLNDRIDIQEMEDE